MAATLASRLRTLLCYLPAVVLSTVPVVAAGAIYSASSPLAVSQLIRDLAITGMSAALVAVVLARAGGRDRTKGAALALAVLLLGAYPPLANSLGVGPCTWGDTVLGLVCAAVLSAILYAIGRHASDALDGSIVSIWMIVVAFITYAGYCLSAQVAGAERAPDRSALGGPPVRLQTIVDTPDIIHIIFDGLGRTDVLQVTYGLDASAIEHELRADGLEVNDAAVANYSYTHLAVSSMLSLQYLDAALPLAMSASDRTLTQTLIAQSTVIRALKAHGYRFTLLSSGYDALADHPLADDGIRGPTLVEQFEAFLLPRTPFRALPIREWTFVPHRRRTRAIFESLRAYAPGYQPRFILAHVLLPHAPFMFDRFGRDVTPPGLFTLADASMFPGSDADYRRGYAEQARFAISVLQDLLVRWRKFPRPPIVIVHGDHGPGLGFDVRNPVGSNSNGRMAVFLGMRGGGFNLSPPASPVNIYRRVFNAAFGTHLPDLPDRSFVSSWQQPYTLTEVQAPQPPRRP